MSSHQPVRVTARLETGIASSAPWGVALDGLLAAQLWADTKADLRAAGTPSPGLHAQDDPPDLELPLARCTTAGDDLWHWQATTAYPLDADHTIPPEARYWSAYVDQHIASRIAATTPATVSSSRGRYRLRRIPTLATICSAVTWTAVGDIDAIAELLAPITSIGKRRGTGEGHVLAWDVAPAPDVEPAEAGHLHPNRTLGRPAPTACTTALPVARPPEPGVAGIRPPYMHRSRQRQLHLPANLEALT